MNPDFDSEISLPYVPDIAGWSENFSYDGFDAKHNVGYWVHLSRWLQDPRLWCEKIYLLLPDGGVLVQHGYGARPAPRGVAGPALSLEVVDPGKVIRIQYNGAARRTSTEGLLAGQPVEQPRERVEFDIAFEATAEAWDFGSTHYDHGDSGNLAFHYEMPGRVHGWIDYRGQRIEMDGVGYRDHSRGVRKLGKMARSTWIHGQIGRRAFALFGLPEWQDGKLVPRVEQAVVWEDGVLHRATCRKQPYIHDYTPGGAEPSRYTVELDSDLGLMTIAARILRTLPYSYNGGSNEFLYGAVSGECAVYEEMTEFVWNGEVGHGNTERSVRRIPF